MWYKVKRIMMRPNGVEKQVRPDTTINNYIPQMTANTQDGFTATSSWQYRWDPRYAFYVSTEWGTDYPFHSPSIGAWNRAWSGIQMPNSIIVSKLTIWARKNVSTYDLWEIRAFNLLWSNNWSTWTNIYSESWLWSSWTVWEVKSWNITGQTTAYKYLKLEVQANRQYVAFDFRNIDGKLQ